MTAVLLSLWVNEEWMFYHQNMFNILRLRQKGSQFTEHISSSFSSMKIVVFCWKFHQNMFPRVQLTRSKHRFRSWLGTNQVTSHYLNQGWPRLLTHVFASLGHELNLLTHFAEEILKYISLNENAWILNKISLKYVAKIQI